MSTAARDARLSAAYREKERQERELARGNYAAALGYKNSPMTSLGERQLPPPTRVKPGGGRVWTFS